MPTSPFRSLALALVLGMATTPAAAWERELTADESAWSVAIDPAGDIIGAGYHRDPATHVVSGLVLKLAGNDGREVWRREIAGTGNGAVLADVALDGNGDAFVVGTVTNADRDIVMAKISGDDGRVLWRHDLDGSAPTEPGSYQTDLGIGVGVGPDGDPIFAAAIYHWTEETNFLAIKFMSTIGSERWRHEVDGGIAGNELLVGLTLAADGDPLLVGALHRETTSQDFAVVRLANADGAEEWRYARDGGLQDGEAAYRVAVDADGDVFAVGKFVQREGDASFDPAVVKLDGATGTELWAYAPTIAAYAYSTHVALDASGNVFTAGRSANGTFALKVLADGTPAWLTHSSGMDDRLRALGTDAGGNVVTAGTFGDPGHLGIVARAGSDGVEIWRVERTTVSGATTAHVDAAGRVVAFGSNAEGGDLGTKGIALRLAPEISGRALRVTDHSDAAAKRSLKLQSRHTGLILATPGGPSDPTIVGATLDLHNPESGELTSATLAATKWTVRSSPKGGITYRLKGGPTDPCQKITVSNGKIEAKCQGTGLGFTLDEATQGTLALRLRTGTISYCASFGGAVQHDFGTLGVGKGSFKAQSAPAPASCPVP